MQFTVTESDNSGETFDGINALEAHLRNAAMDEYREVVMAWACTKDAQYELTMKNGPFYETWVKV